MKMQHDQNVLQAVLVGSLLTNHPNQKKKFIENATHTPLIGVWALVKALTAVVQFNLDSPPGPLPFPAQSVCGVGVCVCVRACGCGCGCLCRRNRGERRSWCTWCTWRHASK